MQPPWRNPVQKACLAGLSLQPTTDPAAKLNKIQSKPAGLMSNLRGWVQILRLGREGYRKIMENLMRVADHLAKGILATGAASS